MSLAALLAVFGTDNPYGIFRWPPGRAATTLRRFGKMKEAGDGGVAVAIVGEGAQRHGWHAGAWSRECSR